VRDIVKALRLLDEVERSKGDLYDWLGEVLKGQEPMSTTFVRLGLDQASRRNVIAYQTRIAVRNATVFRGIRVACPQFETLRQVVADLRQAPAPPTSEQAVTVALAVETRTWELFEHELFAILETHFAPFVASLRKGCERHLALLGSLQGKPAGDAPRPTVAPGPMPLAAWQAAEAERREAPSRLEITAVFSDPTPRITVKELLKTLNTDMLVAILDTLDDSIYLLDTGRRLVYQNAAAKRFAGDTAAVSGDVECASGPTCPTDEDGILTCHEACALKRAMRLEEDQNGQLWLLERGERRGPVAVHLHPLRGRAGEVVGALHVVAHRRMAGTAGDRINELEQLAYLDALTGLANRRYLEVTMLSRLNELQRHRRSFGVLFADVDSLKVVNDSFGHLEGDRVLRAVADTLAGNIRSSDLIGRWGGDEFLGVLGNVDEEQILQTAEKLGGLLACCRCLIAGQELRVSVSIGATVACPEDTLETLIARADRLMFQAKSHARSLVSSDTSLEPATLSFGQPLPSPPG
jgi:diguanylate cyclase (GGDEF)-like protein